MRNRIDHSRPWGRIEVMTNAKTETGQDPVRADIHIYDEIGYYGVSAKDFASQIAELDADELHVFINSPGGAAWDGLAIMNALRRHRATVYVTVDALAASAASVIAMAADHLTMNRGAELMIHDASGMCYGNAADMQAMASTLDKLSDSYADAYAARAGGDRAHWREVMRAETWYTAEEAVLAGLADEWVDAPAAAAHFDLSRFRYRGRAAAPVPAMKLPASEPGIQERNRKENDMGQSVSALEGIRQRLGIADAADDAAILAALDERLDAAAKPTVPEGTTLVDDGVLAQLKADAEAGKAATAALDAARLDGIVDQAIKEGRIAPSTRAAWRAMAERDEEGTAALLAAMPANTIPVAAVGVADGVTTEEDQLYASAWGEKEED